MSTQQLALEPSKSGAVGKSFKQPKQNPEVLMHVFGQMKHITQQSHRGPGRDGGMLPAPEDIQCVVNKCLFDSRWTAHQLIERNGVATCR